MDDDLQARLRREATVSRDDWSMRPVNPDGPEAADRIDHLLAEMARRDAEVEKAFRAGFDVCRRHFLIGNGPNTRDIADVEWERFSAATSTIRDAHCRDIVMALTERFIWQHGHKRRVMHLAGYDRLGRFAGALCGIAHQFDRSCNLPLGRRTCKRCRRVEAALTDQRTPA